MKKLKHEHKILFWTPRILVIIFILFLSLFSFDVFGEGYGFWESVVALFMHLLPALVLAGILWVAWKWELYGGIIFLLMGVIFTLFFDTYETFIGFLILSVPLFLIGILFIWNSKVKKN